MSESAVAAISVGGTLLIAVSFIAGAVAYRTRRRGWPRDNVIDLDEDPRFDPIGPRPPPQGSGGTWQPPGATLEEATRPTRHTIRTREELIEEVGRAYLPPDNPAFEHARMAVLRQLRMRAIPATYDAVVAAFQTEVATAEERNGNALERIDARHTETMVAAERTLRDMRATRRIRIRDHD